MRLSDNRSLILLAAAAAIGAPVHAQIFSGLISGRLTEAIRLKATTRVYYYSTSGRLEDLDRFDSPPVIEAGNIGGTYNASVRSIATPTSVSAKDYGSAQVDFTYTNGGPTAPDSLRIQLSVHGSAEHSFVGSPLNQATLAVSAAISYVLLGEPDGESYRVTLPSIPTLTDPSHESLSVELSGGGMSPIRRAPGSAPLTVVLDGRQNYVFELGYSLAVPFGTDPDYSYDFSGGGLEVSAIPEFSGFAPLTGLALAGWGLWRRRRS